jgi:hypothetical protein
VGIDQSLGIDLEMGGGRMVDVAGRARLDDLRARAKQQPASLMWVRSGGGGPHLAKGLACHDEFHHAWPYHV